MYGWKRTFVGLFLAALLWSCGDDPVNPVEKCEPAGDTLHFGIVLLGDSLTSNLRVYNTGTTSFSFSATVSGAPFSLAEGDSAHRIVSPGDSTEIPVVFEPTLVGTWTRWARFSGDLCSDVKLVGTGATPCSVNADELDFGRVSLGHTATKEFIVSNRGMQPLEGLVGDGCAEFSVVDGAGAFTLEQGESLRVAVEFVPASLGLKSCLIELGTDYCSSVACAGQGSRTWNIRVDGNGDAPSVQAGIDSANVGDIVLVHPGTYNEAIDFKGKDIIVRSADGPESTVLDGVGFVDVSVVTFRSGESRAAVLEGLTITGGERGVFVLDAEPSILENVVTQNGGVSQGAGIWCAGTYDPGRAPWSPLIERNEVTRNVSTNISGGIGTWFRMIPKILDNHVAMNQAVGGDGGGIYYRGSDSGGLIRGNTVTDNFAGDHGGGIYIGSTPQGSYMEVELSWNLISTNRANGREGTGDSGGGVWLWESNAWVHHNTIVGNEGHGAGSPNGGGMAILQASTPIIEQNIIAFSMAGGGIWCSGESTPIIRKNLAWENVGGDGAGSCPTWWQSNGNIVADPEFCDIDGRDYTLPSTSPAMRHSAGPLGAFSTPGCSGPLTQTTSWDRLRTLYR